MLTYSLLLKLYKGTAAVVEQLDEADLEALRIRTPLGDFVDRASTDGTPRHILLTGNAGDGKTFAARTASASTRFSAILDASAGEPGATAPPIPALAANLSARLARGERLLVAINRGQLERLQRHLQTEETPLGSLVRAAREQSGLRPRWEADVSGGEVALIDLGIFDTTSQVVLDAMIEKVCDAEAGESLSVQTSRSFHAAKEALSDARVRAWVSRAAQAARATGAHVTMRHLWSFLAYLVTGARGVDSAEPLSLLDAVGARLFDERPQGPVFDAARTRVDPARVPQPLVARLALEGRLADDLEVCPGLKGLAPRDGPVFTQGRAVIRAAVVHGAASATSQKFTEETFTRVVDLLQRRPPGWHDLGGGMQRRLLSRAYQGLGLWCSGPSFPAWQALCYDSQEIDKAPSVANGEVDVGALRLALPRPAPHCAAALNGAWRPPFVWMAAIDASGKIASEALALNAALFDALHGTAALALTVDERLTVQRWLSSLPLLPHGDETVRVAHRSQRRPPLSLTKDALSELIRVEWEGSDG